MESSTSDQLTLFAEDSRDPARISASQEKALELKDRAQDYGQSSPVLLAKYDRATQSWRTSQLCLDGDLAQFSETWPRSGMTRNGTAYQLPTLVPLTAETESGSWPTPRSCTAMGANFTENTAKAKFPNLEIVVAQRMWPTPKANSANGAGIHGQGGMDLQTAVKLWPTPQAADNRDRGNLSSGAIRRRMLKGKQLMLSQVVSEVSGALNPTWVEWLMGFPPEWTALEHWETPSSLRLSKSSGKQSSKRKREPND